MKKRTVSFILILLACLLLMSCAAEPESNPNLQTWKSSNGITLIINNEDLIVTMKGDTTSYGRIDRAITSGGTYVIGFDIGGEMYAGYFVVSTNLKTATMGSVYYERV